MLNPQQVAAARAQLGIQPQAAQTADRVTAFQNAVGTTSPPPGAGEQFASDLGAVGDTLKANLKSDWAPPAPGTHKTPGQVAEGALNTVGDVLGAGYSAFGALPGVKQAFQGLSDVGTSAAGELMKNPAYADAAQHVQQYVDAHPNVKHDTGSILNIAMLLAGGRTGEDVLPKISDVGDKISDALTAKPSEAAPSTSAGPSAVDSIKAYFGKGHVDPRIAASAQRLEDPASLYKEYADSAAKSVKDVKADAPIEQVGEKIGNAYDQVIKTRRAIGQTMGDELKKVSGIKLDVGDAAAKFDKTLEDNGVSFDENVGKLVSSSASKMTSFDKNLVGKYTTALKNLGNNPTVGEVDAFLSRIPQELDVAKAAKNITDTTNGERIIKGSLNDLRSSLTNRPELADYGAARKSYADLSNFLDEGAKYLGAKTGGGEFARDTSVAKSAAESILAGGKKAWLGKLEKLTGYPALDDSTLAIQAMKDVGDMRGLSLFKALGEGDIPTTPSGILGKVLNWAGSKATRVIAGKPAEQTEAFLRSIKQAAPEAVKPTITIAGKTMNLDDQVKALQTSPEKVPLYRGTNPGNENGLRFTTDPAWAKNFSKGGDLKQTNLPKGSKIHLIEPDDFAEPYKLGIRNESQAYKYILEKTGADALVGHDSMNSKALEVIVHPKHL